MTMPGAAFLVESPEAQNEYLSSLKTAVGKVIRAYDAAHSDQTGFYEVVMREVPGHVSSSVRTVRCAIDPRLGEAG